MPLIHQDQATDKAAATSRAGSRVALLGFSVVLLLALALRLVYLLGASPFVDEYSTVMAVQGILSHGIPTLPAGFFYGHDVLFSYAAAGAALLWPDDLVAIRLLSLLAALGTVALTYAIGRRLFSWPAGLLAAAFLALSPEGVLWGARARAYALEQLLALVAFWLFYLGVEQERQAWRRLGLLALVAAVFAHPESALILPGLALAVLVLHGPSWWRHLDRLVEFGLAGAGVVARYLLQKVVAGGTVGGFATIADARPTFGFLANWGSGFETVLSFLLSGPIISATILGLVAILAVFLGPFRDRRSYAVRFLAIVLAAILVQMALLIGGTWQSVRYLLFAFPLIFLLAGGGFDALREWLSSRLGRGAVAAVLLVVAIVALLPAVPKAVATATSEEIAFDRAFQYVQEHGTEGDLLATSAPAAAWVSLGQVDYFSLGKTFEEFVWQKDGRWYDKWLGIPLVRSAPELKTILDDANASGETLWFVTDQSRLLGRFEADFVQTVWERMELVHAGERAMVFRSRPAQAYAVESGQPRRETFDGLVSLAGYAAGTPDQAGQAPQGAMVVAPGQSIPLRLSWRAQAPLSQTYTVFVHVVDAQGQGFGQVDGLPLGGLYPMYLWQPGIRYPDTWNLELFPEVPPGRYRLELGLYDLVTGDRLRPTEGPGLLPGDVLLLDTVTVPGDMEVEQPLVPLDADFGDSIRLLGISPEPAGKEIKPGDELELTLHWQTIAPTDEAYTLFVHVVGPDGTVPAQWDGQPQGGHYPTAFWDPGERLEDHLAVSIPGGMEPGTYDVIAGLYLLSTGERLPVGGDDAVAAGDAVRLMTLQVER